MQISVYNVPSFLMEMPPKAKPKPKPKVADSNDFDEILHMQIEALKKAEEIRI